MRLPGGLGALSGPARLGVLVACFATGRPAEAARFSVTHLEDGHDAAPGDGACADASGRCTLRAAVEESDALAGADEIILLEGVHALTLPAGQLTVHGELAIRGAGPDTSSIDQGVSEERVMAVEPGGVLDLEGLALTGGTGGDNGRGAGLSVDRATARLAGCALRGNAALAAAALRAFRSDVTLQGCVLVDNYDPSFQGGACIEADRSRLRILDSELSADTGLISVHDGWTLVERSTLQARCGSWVPCIQLEGTTIIRDSEIPGSDVTLRGESTLVRCELGTGVRLYGDSALIEDSTFRDVEFEAVRATDPSFRLVMRRTSFVGGDVNSVVRLGPGDAVIDDCTFTGAVTNDVIVAIGTALTVRRTTIADNTCWAWGAALRMGGDGTLDLRRTTIRGNRGVGLSVQSGSAAVSGCTMTGNSTGSEEGAGIAVGSATVTVLGSTVVGNTRVDTELIGGEAAGGISVSPEGRLEIGGSIVAGNTWDGFFERDCSGTVSSLGWLLVGEDEGCDIAGDQTGVLVDLDPLLGGLADNGGPTLTHALLPGSPALDAGDPDGCRDAAGEPVATDQRGADRVADGDGDGVATCDLGAVETCGASGDADGDGVPDACDRCPGVADDQGDADADGAGDACDACTDTDGDGWGDPGFAAATCAVDACPEVADAANVDTDGDGIGDACDACPTVADPDAVDTDRDGLGDACDACPRDADVGADPDGDGLDDACDTCPELADPEQLDGDRDGVGDACDACPSVPDPEQADDDGDGVGDACDGCPAVFDPAQEDADGDAAGDACDDCTDTDGDGWGDPGFPASTCPVDTCPDLADGDNGDADRDGAGNPCDACTDTDGDGWGDPGFPANECAADLCPGLASDENADLDGDGAGDACDVCPDTFDPEQLDADRDGWGDACDACPDLRDDQADRDGDGWGDACDTCPDLADPAQADLDGDRAGDPCDTCPEVPDPRQVDTDADGWGDACDGCPLLPDDQTDADGDGAGDACDNCGQPNPDQSDCDGDGQGEACQPGDFDGDGVDNSVDGCPCLFNAAQADRDGDGIGDSCDPCPDMADNGLDRDGDGLGNACDSCPLDFDELDEDRDGDGYGDACDNCPADANPDQADSDDDGVGDACTRVPEPSPVDLVPRAPPLRVEHDAPGLLAARWEDVGAESYDLYRGTLSALSAGGYDHVRFGQCGLREPSAVMPVGPGSIYLLVVARDGPFESSSGRRSDGSERPPARVLCP